MAYKGIFPVPITVPQGGSGVATLTNLAVGSGTSAFITRSITGTANQLTVTNGSGATANPTIALASTVIKSSQSLFEAFLSANDTLATGDSTLYVLGSGNVLTLDANQGSSITTGGVFTAPVTGKYLFQCCFNFSNVTAGFTSCYGRIITTSKTYEFGHENCINMYDSSGGNISLISMVIANMSANDTATFAASVSGGAKTITIRGGTGRTFISGALIC